MTKLLLEYGTTRVDISDMILENSVGIDLVGPVFKGSNIPAIFSFSVSRRVPLHDIDIIEYILNAVKEREDVKIVLLSIDTDTPAVIFKGALTRTDKFKLSCHNYNSTIFYELSWRSEGLLRPI